MIRLKNCYILEKSFCFALFRHVSARHGVVNLDVVDGGEPLVKVKVSEVPVVQVELGFAGTEVFVYCKSLKSDLSFFKVDNVLSDVM